MNIGTKGRSIRNEDISPIVLTCIYQSRGMDMTPGQRFTRRTVYDYELEFFTESKGSMMIGDKKYLIEKGDVIFKRPGVISQGILPYNCYLICFDMLGNTGKKTELYNFLTEQELQQEYANPFLDTIPILIRPSSYEKYHILFSAVFSEFVISAPHNQVLLKSYILQILYQLYADSLKLKREGVLLSAAYSMRIRHVCDYIKQNIKTKLDLEALSKAAGLSPSYFQRVFKRTTGISPNEYIIHMRLGMAKEMLLRTNTSITEVALECGFQNIPYFSYVFKQYMKISPGEFRKRQSYI